MVGTAFDVQRWGGSGSLRRIGAAGPMFNGPVIPEPGSLAGVSFSNATVGQA